MGLIIDTGVLIHAEKAGQRSELLRILDQIPDRYRLDEAYVSVITVSELRVGCERAVDPVIRSRRTAFVDSVIEQIPVLPITTPIARLHARLVADLLSRGTPIGVHDSWIAATAMYHDCAVVTGNYREFERVEDLEVLRMV